MNKLMEEYQALKNATYTPAVEQRMEELERVLRTRPVHIRRSRLPYKGSYEEMLGSSWREYKISADEAKQINGK